MLSWGRLTEYLRDSGVERVVMPRAKIAELIGGDLPASHRYPAFWSNSGYYATAWQRAGYEATRRGLADDQIGFIRVGFPGQPAVVADPRAVPLPAEAPVPAAFDVVLVGCVKTKAAEARPARDLYQSPMFDKRRAHAEASGKPWFILSAEHGLLRPDALVAPYDVYLAAQSTEYVQAWGTWVVARLVKVLGSIRSLTFEVHASSAYVEAIVGPMARAGGRVLAPLSGLRQGEQLAWYDRPHVVPPLPPSEQPTGEAPRDGPTFDDLVVVDGPHPTGPFDFKWPTAVESFASGVYVVVEVGGREHRVRHGMGSREVYGKARPHSVTFIDGWAAAEAVAADDYVTSRCLVSVLKAGDGTLVRPGDPVPPAYQAFPLVSHAEQIVAQYSRNSLAVRLHEDDLMSWIGYALARVSVRRPAAAAAEPLSPTPATQASTPALATSSEAAVVSALLEYGASQQPVALGAANFTPHAEANALILRDPFAFLLAVVFDQGIPAERAWRAPYDLKQRLGHLDPRRMVAGRHGVRAAVGQPPVLHRFREKMTEWLVEAAQIVCDDYEGDAAKIWSDEPMARELQRRLHRFPGIGQKKAAMAVEILDRDLGVVIREMSGSDIAYDVHVRRVFLRTGLAEYDDLDHMVGVARRLHPERPGGIDFPAWLVGRQWCRAGPPDCASCPLNRACPKEVARASAVRGV